MTSKKSTSKTSTSKTSTSKTPNKPRKIKVRTCRVCDKTSWLDQCDECRTQICYFCLNPYTWGTTRPVTECPKCKVKYPEDKFCYHDFNMDDLIDYLEKNLYESRQLSDSDFNLRHTQNVKNRVYKIIRLLLANPHSHKTYNDVLGLDPNFKKRMNSQELYQMLKNSKGKKFEGRDHNFYLMNGRNDVYIAYYDYDDVGIKLTRSIIRRLMSGYRPNRLFK